MFIKFLMEFLVGFSFFVKSCFLAQGYLYEGQIFTIPRKIDVIAHVSRGRPVAFLIS